MSALAQDAMLGSTNLPTQIVDAFQQLVQDLSNVLGPSSGLDSADVDPLDLQKLMEGYTSTEAEWQKYAWGDPCRTYTRNLVDKGNGKSNLLILVWTPGRGSPIHDHADAHCVMKILKGSLRETLYTWPDRNLYHDGKPSPLKITKETIYQKDQVTYISDKVGVNLRSENPAANDDGGRLDFTEYQIQIQTILQCLFTSTPLRTPRK